MLEHIVIFQWKPDTNSATRSRIVAELLALNTLVPGILSLSAGTNFSERSQGFETGLVVRFLDKHGLEVYQQHPEHQRVSREWIRPHLERLIAVDYEFPTT